MKIYISIIVFFSFVIPKASAQEAKIISASEMIKLQQQEPQLQILDVRTLPELEGGIIKDAINIDFFKEDFSEKVLKLDPKLPIVVYCASGRRSAKAAQFLKQNGYTKVFDLKGGFNEWKNSGNPIIFLKKK